MGREPCHWEEDYLCEVHPEEDDGETPSLFEEMDCE